MKFIVEPRAISPSLKKASKVIPNKPLVAILDHFKIDVFETTMDVTAFDGDVALTISLPIVSREQGDKFSFCVDGAKFTQAVSAINSAELQIELRDDAILRCKHNKGVFTLTTLNADDFPMKEMKESKTTMLSMQSLVKLLGVSYTAGTDSLLPQTNGVYFDFTQAGINGVATDTRTLACKKECLDCDFSTIDSFIMPNKVASVVKQFIDDSEKQINIANDGNAVEFTCDNWRLMFKQISGKYPNYAMVIPQKNDNIVTVNRLEILESLTRSLLFTPSTTAIKTTIKSNGTIEITAQDIDYNLSSTEIVNCMYYGDDITIGFSGQALVETFNNIQANEIEIQLNGSDRAIIVSPKGDDSELCLVMPMMI